MKEIVKYFGLVSLIGGGAFYLPSWDGERWWYVKRPPPETHTGTMFDVFTIDENNAWAVGDARTILHYQP